VAAPACPYCDFFAGRASAPAFGLDEADHASFMGRFQPTGPGYSLVVPKHHVEDLHALAADELAGMLAAVQRVSQAVMTAFGATGTTILQNNGHPAQRVRHLHFHVVPRHEGDGYPSTSTIEVPDEDLRGQAARLRAALAESRLLRSPPVTH
jgi:histidine triad (HIT) family protein